MTMARASASCAENSGASAGPSTGSRRIRATSMSPSPGPAQDAAVETSRHAFAYVFAGSGTFRNASEPRGSGPIASAERPDTTASAAR